MCDVHYLWRATRHFPRPTRQKEIGNETNPETGSEMQKVENFAQYSDEAFQPNNACGTSNAKEILKFLGTPCPIDWPAYPTYVCS